MRDHREPARETGTCTRVISTLFSTMGLVRGWVHYLLIFLCVILAARVIQLGVMRSGAGGPCVCGMDLIVINVFSDVKEFRSTVAIKGVFQTPGCVIDPEFSANSWVQIELLCDASAHERTCSSIAWVKRAVRLGEFVSAGVRVGSSPLPFFSRGPVVITSRPPSPRLPIAPAPLCLTAARVCLLLSVGDERAWRPEMGVGSSACHTDLAYRHVGRVV